ncbi:MAG TPA: hypothetical protein VGO85_18405 [Caldimonas sp.]|jgi:hypothetical protein|nr:hypothetical protein [Caldimonas sp.]
MITGESGSKQPRSGSLVEEDSGAPTPEAPAKGDTERATGEKLSEEEGITEQKDDRSDTGVAPDSEEEAHEPVDPHPDTPDDFDEGVECDRESVEAVRKDP